MEKEKRRRVKEIVARGGLLVVGTDLPLEKALRLVPRRERLKAEVEIFRCRVVPIREEKKPKREARK